MPRPASPAIRQFLQGPAALGCKLPARGFVRHLGTFEFREAAAPIPSHTLAGLSRQHFNRSPQALVPWASAYSPAVHPDIVVLGVGTFQAYTKELGWR